MREEDLIKDIEEIEKEIEEAKEDVRSTRKPIYIVVGAIMILLIIMMIIPYHSLKIDPQPKNIPTISEVYSAGQISHHNYSIDTKESYRLLYSPKDVKITADLIAQGSCTGNRAERVCYSKAIFYFVRDRFDYINDPTAYEYVKSAEESLATGVGDCDDASVLLANLEGAIGIRSRLVFIPGHVYVQIYLPEAQRRYTEDGWVSLDPTCKYCGFGEIPRENREKAKTIVEL